jgi:hypothetical protein
MAIPGNQSGNLAGIEVDDRRRPPALRIADRDFHGGNREVIGSHFQRAVLPDPPVIAQGDHGRLVIDEQRQPGGIAEISGRVTPAHE